jgi:hypothetical protein
MRRRWVYGWLIAIVLLTSGCGGLQSGQQALCTAETFKPNYVRSPEMERLLRWRSFPVRVYFEKDENYSGMLQSIALHGFDQWVEATEMKIRYQVVDSRESAHIVVRFDPNTRDGKTHYHFYPNGELEHADIYIGTKGNNRIDIQSVAAHEFGHALGIGGHSVNPNDMMYRTYTSGVPLRITESDLNTLKTAYCNLFLQRSRPVPTVLPNEPLLQHTIHCGNHP